MLFCLPLGKGNRIAVQYAFLEQRGLICSCAGLCASVTPVLGAVSHGRAPTPSPLHSNCIQPLRFLTVPFSVPFPRDRRPNTRRQLGSKGQGTAVPAAWDLASLPLPPRLGGPESPPPCFPSHPRPGGPPCQPQPAFAAATKAPPPAPPALTRGTVLHSDSAPRPPPAPGNTRGAVAVGSAGGPPGQSEPSSSPPRPMGARGRRAAPPIALSRPRRFPVRRSPPPALGRCPDRRAGRQKPHTYKVERGSTCSDKSARQRGGADRSRRSRSRVSTRGRASRFCREQSSARRLETCEGTCGCRS